MWTFETRLMQIAENWWLRLLCLPQWENHAKSLKLEEQTLAKIKSRIEDKVMKNSGTWIDWQYLLKAAELLMKVDDTCSMTLHY